MLSSTRVPVVYVVDDDADVLGSLRFLLEIDGFEVRTFRSGEALLKAAASGAADCFIIDYRMPGMTGMELVRLLRSRNIETPVILITGHRDGNIPIKAAAEGISHVLFKPYVEESLVAHIWDVIDAGHQPEAGGHLRDST